jgi:hypothetical protein
MVLLAGVCEAYGRSELAQVLEEWAERRDLVEPTGDFPAGVEPNGPCAMPFPARRLRLFRLGGRIPNFITRALSRDGTPRKSRKFRITLGRPPEMDEHKSPATKPNSSGTIAWIAPRRSPVRVRLAPLREPLQPCSFAPPWLSPAASAGVVVARSLARSLRSPAPAAYENTASASGFRPYDRLSSGDEMELFLERPGSSSGTLGCRGGRLHSSLEADGRESVRRCCLSSRAGVNWARADTPPMTG